MSQLSEICVTVACNTHARELDETYVTVVRNTNANPTDEICMAVVIRKTVKQQYQSQFTVALSTFLNQRDKFSV